MDARASQETLREEGFSRTFAWSDAPGAYYRDHTHPGTTTHIILKGEMTVTSDGRTRTYKAGERFDVPAGTVHSARTGPQGCSYIVGEK